MRKTFATLISIALTSCFAVNSASALDSDSKDSKRPKVGLALGGGGSRGSAHVGVIKVLLEENIPIDLIAGTSIGSVVGGFYASGMPMEDIAEVFEKNTFTKEFAPMPILRLLIEPTVMSLRLFGDRSYNGLDKGWKFIK